MSAVVRDAVRDADLPQLGLLLADEPLRTWLGEWGQTLLRRHYLRYKPGTSCVLALELASGRAFLRHGAEADRGKMDKWVARAQPADVLAYDRCAGLLLASSSADRDLPALADLAGSVQTLFPGSRAEIQTLVHKPQRRWVGLTVPSGQQSPVVLRAYRRRRAADAAARLKLARRGPRPFRVPRLIGRSSGSSLLAVEYLPGQTLDAALALGEATLAVTVTGRALARLHDCEVTGLPVARIADPAETAALVGILLPHLHSRAEEIAAWLAGSTPAPDRAGWCHGDFSFDQVVLTGERRLGLVDWDRAGQGEPAVDLATAVAAEPDDGMVDHLFAGYESVRPLPKHLSWYVTRARLLRLAEPFRTASPDWGAEIEHRLTVLESTL